MIARIKKSILISVLFLTGITGFAQQDAMFSQYMFNTLSVNPGYAGSREVLNAMLLARRQWVGFEGAPNTQTLTVHAPFLKKNIGLGFSLINDAIGPVQETDMFVDFAFKFKVYGENYLSLGLKSGFGLHNAYFRELETADFGDGVLAKNISNEFLPNFGFGAYYYSDRYYIGVSTPKLMKNDIGKNLVSTGAAGKKERHTFLIGGFVKDITPEVVFKPTVLAKFAVGSPVSIDLTASFLFYQRIWAGAMVRIGDSFGGIVQYQVTDQLSIGYAYDFTTSELRKYNTGTHEFMLSYDFIFSPSRIKSPRYF